MKKLIAGNWKMNLNFHEVQALCEGIKAAVPDDPAAEILVCPPFIYVGWCGKFFQDCAVQTGGQNCAVYDNGAYTGEISAQMLAGIKARYVILGHSERRQYFGETDEIIKQKASLAHQYNLTPIICVGETEEQREKGQERDIVEAQIKACLPDTAKGENTVIAYEPVWAIGTGKTATPEDVKDMHAFIRETLKETLAEAKKVRILYGGSMKPENAAELLATANVDGGLIGGASLKAEDFMGIINAAKE